ncbi:MAG: NADH:flavin oxidoreductase, partial [Chloroflexota bacterium]|nr:NADH:flavin oxidoreductase [Chloroflexota bacterium]
MMATSSPYSLLFSPIKIGAMTVRNRIVLPPMATVYAGRDGAVTQQLLDYYEERAKGGVGLLIAEYANVHGATGLIHAEQLRIDDDKFIPGLRQLAGVIKKHGARAAIQLGHGGALAVPSLLTGAFFAPSAIKRPRQVPRDRPAPREMTVGEIQMLVDCFAEAARRAKEAGFEGIELHFAHRYLGAQVLSGAWNQRTDEYGGS